MNIDELEQILNLLKRNDISEFELVQEGTHLKLSRAATVVTNHSVVQTFTQLEPAVIGTSTNGHASGNGVGEPINSNHVKVESPIVGTFYRKPTPDAEPFVKEGAQVNKGDTLCIVEAMKLMNEIEAPVSGRIEKVLLTDGQVVEYGEVLFLINPAV